MKKTLPPFLSALGSRIIPFKNLSCLLMLLLLSSGAWGQVTLLSTSGDGGFETGTTFTANSWTAANTGGNRLWQIGTGQSGYTGSRAAFIGDNATTVGTTTSSRTAIHLYRSVTIPSGASNITLSFKYKQSAVDNTYDYLKVFINSNTPVYGTAQSTGLLTTVDPNSTNNYSSFTTVTTTIPDSNAGNTRNLIFTFTADGVSPHAYGAIDDIQITYVLPTCAIPTSLTSSSITTTGATINWTAPTTGTTPASYEYEVRTSGAAGSGTTGLVTSGTTTAPTVTANITGLTTATSYSYYVRSNCGGGDYSSWASGSFSTACDIPSNPGAISVSGASSSGFTLTYSAASPVPSSYVLFNTTGTSTAATTIPTLTNGTTYTGSTSYTIGGTSYSCISTSSVSPIALSGGVSNTQYNYFLFSRNATNSCSGNPYFSTGVTVSAVTCPAAPTTPVNSSITTNSATVSWTASAVGGGYATINYSLEVYTDSGYTTAISGSPFAMGTAVSQNLTGLNSSTTYYYRIVANNGVCNSTYLTGSINTLCPVENAPTSVQTFSTFSGSAPNPICWSEATGTLAATSNLTAANSAWLNKSGGFANANASNVAVSINLYSTKNEWFISNQIDLGNIPGIYRLKYDMAVTSFNGTTSQSTLSTHNVKVIISTDGGTTWSNANTLKTYTGVGTYSNTGQTEYIDLISYSGIVKIAFVATTTSTTPDIDFHIDNFAIETIPTCFPVTALTSTSISYQSATIGWTAPASGTTPAGYEYEVRTSGAAGSGATGLVTSGTTTAPTVSASLTGLSGGTSYTYYIRSNCGGGDYSSWVSATFSTTNCNVPTGVTSSSVTTTTATISWTAPATGSPAGYEYEVRTSGAAGSGATGLVTSGFTTAPTISANLTGLLTNTSYSVYLRSNCYSGFNSSWTSASLLITLQIPATLPYSDDFSSNNYTFVNGSQTNKWAYGSVVGNTGNSIYISNDNGVTHAYSFGSSSVVQAYRDIVIPAGATIANFSFDWLGNAETCCDYTRVWLVPTSFIPTAGTQIFSGTGRIQVAGNFNSQTTWQTYTNSTLDVSSFANTTMRLVFEWRNDSSTGPNPPGAIDNISFKLPNTWTGTTSSSWSTASNWSDTAVPSSTDNILISSNGTNAPVMDVDVTIPAGKSLTISGTGTLTVAPGKTLTIAGTANFGGKAVTIKSDATGNGAIGQVTGTLTGATNVTVERYLPAKRAWRAITAPVTMTTSINANWQEGGTGNSTNGFDIWDPNGGTGIITGGSGSSLLQYSSSANTWTGITNTSASSSMLSGSVNKPFMAFVTGPYGANNVNSGAAVTTLRATGTLLTGNKTYVTTANKYTFIGNPYASPLDLTAMLNNTSNATASFGGNVWVWDANVLGTYSVGTYNLFDFAASNYSNTSNNANISGAQIQSGQAFFVKSTDGATFTIKETHKGSVFTNAVFRSGTPEILRANLFKQVNNEWAGRDGAMTVILSDAAANQTPNKMTNGSENIAFTKNGASFASNHHLPLVASDVLNVKVWNTTAGANYKLKINTEAFTATNLTATLEDLFTNSRTPLNLEGAAVEYPFTVTTDALSSGDRFRIVFQNAVLGTNNPTANGFQIIPNPVTGDSFQVNLGTLATGTYSYSICNAIGQEVEKGTLNNATQNTNYEVKMSTAATGIYVMKIKGNDNSVFTAKIIKK